MTLDFTRCAEEDLRKISDYTRDTWGEIQQDHYLRQLYKKFQQIVESPERWRSREDLFPKCQIATAGRHLILFQLDEEVLLVVRILHGAMDLHRHIPDEVNHK